MLETIKRLGLELQIIFNKGAVMVLPPGINKASGLAAALAESNCPPSTSSEWAMPRTIMPSCNAVVVRAAVATRLLRKVKESDLVLDAPRGAGVIDADRLS